MIKQIIYMAHGHTKTKSPTFYKKDDKGAYWAIGYLHKARGATTEEFDLLTTAVSAIIPKDLKEN